MPRSTVDGAVLRALVEALDAGAGLVEPSELVLLSNRSSEAVDGALAAMRRHRPELFRAVLDAEGRVVAVTGVTAAGRRLAQASLPAPRTSTGLGAARGASLRRQSLRVAIGVAVGVIVRVVTDHLLPD